MPGKWRFVVDYRKLNDLTVPEPLQMCDPKAQFETLMGKEIFGCIDMRSFYRQILLEESSKMFTGFATEDGTFVYNRVPMGIKNACSYSQRKLQEVLARNPVLFKAGVKNFFDDVPIGAMNDDEFLDIVKNLLDVCRECKLKLNKEKSVLGVDSITHLGFIIDRNGRIYFNLIRFIAEFGDDIVAFNEDNYAMDDKLQPEIVRLKKIVLAVKQLKKDFGE